jgi:hypothetical protein
LDIWWSCRWGLKLCWLQAWVRYLPCSLSYEDSCSAIYSISKGFAISRDTYNTEYRPQAENVYGITWTNFKDPFVRTITLHNSLVSYDTVKQTFNTSTLLFFSFLLTTCFGPYRPSSGEIYNWCLQGLFPLPRIGCTYTTWRMSKVLRPVVPNTCYQT